MYFIIDQDEEEVLVKTDAIDYIEKKYYPATNQKYFYRICMRNNDKISIDEKDYLWLKSYIRNGYDVKSMEVGK